MSTTTQPPKPKRRWCQFSLRTLLVVVTVSCVPLAWIGWRMHRARENRARVAAAAAIEKLGGEVVSLHDGLGLKVTIVNDAGLEPLKDLTALQYLYIEGPVTDAGLKHLNGLSDLQSLSLDSTNVTDAGLEHLKGLTTLKKLRLDTPRITDAGREHLKGLTNLQLLDLSGTNVTDEGVKKLQQALPNCKIERH